MTVPAETGDAPGRGQLGSGKTPRFAETATRPCRAPWGGRRGGRARRVPVGAVGGGRLGRAVGGTAECVLGGGSDSAGGRRRVPRLVRTRRATCRSFALLERGDRRGNMRGAALARLFAGGVSAMCACPSFQMRTVGCCPLTTRLLRSVSSRLAARGCPPWFASSSWTVGLANDVPCRLTKRIVVHLPRRCSGSPVSDKVRSTSPSSMTSGPSRWHGRAPRRDRLAGVDYRRAAPPACRLLELHSLAQLCRRPRSLPRFLHGGEQRALGARRGGLGPLLLGRDLAAARRARCCRRRLGASGVLLS